MTRQNNQPVFAAPLKIYLAGSYHRRDELRGVGFDLLCDPATEGRVVITSRWLKVAHNGIPDTPLVEHDLGNLQQWAIHDLEDIDAADMLIAFTEDNASGRNRGGRHVELGYAIARGKRVVIAGPRENIFCYLPGVVPLADATASSILRYLEGHWLGNAEQESDDVG